jgi:tetratricopeptide (TPR) repeat protein
MQTIFELQDQYGGLLELRFGDKGAHLFLIWGAPIAYENDIERSLNFIFELQSRTTIPINAGVTYRMAHAGFIGSDMAQEYTAFGRGANLAARFMSSAPRGEIWVDENVFQKASRYFDFEYGGQQHFKGFGQPQKYYVLVERKEQVENEYGGQFVGRQEELHRLHDFVLPALSGQFAGFLLVSGEPGMGKSRLLHTFLSDLASHKPDSSQVFLAQTDEIIRQPFNPFRYWLNRYFEISDTLSESRNKRSFNRKLDELINTTQDHHLAEELDRTRSFLGALVGLSWPDSLYEQLEARDRYENTIIALNTLLQAESLQKPTILFIEDIHWLDADSRSYLPSLLRAMEDDSEKQFAFAVLATARLEDVSLEFDGIAYKEIELAQLDREGLYSLASSILAGRPAESLLDLLSERSEGNPFFAEEFLHYLIHHNLLDCQPDGCIVISDQTATLPETIGSLLVARLDHLMQEVKEIVQTAAVLGREFEVTLLAHMLSNPAGLDEKLEEAKQAAICIPLSKIRYIFRHALMRDSAYNMLIMVRRKQLHNLAVNAIETVYRDHLSAHYSELAYHAFHGERFDKARDYYRLAGETAMEAYQNALAAEYFSQALALTPADAAADRFNLLFARILPYERIGVKEERQKDIKELEALAKQLDDPEKWIRYLLERSNLDLDTDVYEDAIRSARQAVSLAEEISEYKHAAHGYRYAGTALFRMGKYQQAVEEMQKALDCANRVAEPELLGSVLNNLGLVYLDQGKVDLAIDSFSQALEIAQKGSQLGMQAKYLNNLAQAIAYRGDFVSAQSYFERTLELCRKTGSRTGEGMVLGNLGWIAANLGDFEAAHSYQLENLRINRQVSQRFAEGFAMINLSAVSGALGNYAEAIRWAEQALALTQQINNLNGEAWAFTYLGHALLAQEQWPEAAAAYHAAVRIRNQLEQSVMAAEPLAGLAQISFIQGNVEEACQILEPVLEMLAAGSKFEGADEPIRIYFSCYKVLDALNDDRALSVLEKGYAALHARAAQIPDETIRKRFIAEISHHHQIQTAWENNNRSA